MSSSTGVTAPTMAWDPKSPSSLLLPSMRTTADGERIMQIDSFAAQDGIGANSIELSTLLTILNEVHLSSDSSTHSYRQALHKCIEEWDKSSNSSSNDASSLEMLKLVYAITHLTESIILNPNPSLADFIPFLRLHYLPSVEDEATFEQDPHPEEHEEYWSLIEQLVRRGCTSYAWSLLSNHSICKRAYLTTLSSSSRDGNDNEYYEQQRQADREGLFALRAILQSAPLPGGRTDDDDAGLVNDDDEEEEEFTSSLLDGVRRLDYQLWNSSDTTNMALTSYRTWKTAIDNYSATSTSPLSVLQRREPRLIPIIELLQGDLSSLTFTSWPEVLCADLLYVCPNLDVRDLSTRLKKYLKIFDGERDGFAQTLLAILEGNHGRIISVLHELGGGSGAALPATMTSLLCNQLMKSGLLPPGSTTDELQTNLLLAAADAILSSTTSNGIGMRLMTLFLLPHCSPKRDIHITSSLAEALEHFNPETDAEAKEVLDLLRPLITKKSQRVLDGCISIIISRFRYYEKQERNPSNNDRKRKKNAKTSIEWLIRGVKLEESFYANNDIRKQEMTMQGVRITNPQKKNDDITAASGSVGSCVGLIIRKCQQLSHDLLQLLLGNSNNCDPGVVSEVIFVLQDEYKDTLDSVRLLSSLNRIVNTFLSEDSNSHTLRATEITVLLSRNVYGYCLAPSPQIQWGLLMLALPILKKEEMVFDKGLAADFQSAFSTEGIRVMMERVLHITEMKEENKEETKKLERVGELYESLSKGLMRAIISENAHRKQGILQAQRKVLHTKRKLRSIEINSYTSNEQEELVQQLLDL